METISPWRQIWIRPRNTIRAFLDSENPERNMILIAMLAGFIQILDRMSLYHIGDRYSLAFIAITSLVGGPIVGIIGLYLISAVLKITGGWIGGRGTYSGLRVAVTRGINAPVILIGILWIPELILFGKDLFMEEAPRIVSNVTLTIFFYLFLFLEVVFGLWAFVIACKSIGEAHQFSASKAFWSFLIPGFILLGIIVLFVVLTGFLL